MSSDVNVGTSEGDRQFHDYKLFKFYVKMGRKKSSRRECTATAKIYTKSLSWQWLVWTQCVLDFFPENVKFGKKSYLIVYELDVVSP